MMTSIHGVATWKHVDLNSKVTSLMTTFVQLVTDMDFKTRTQHGPCYLKNCLQGLQPVRLKLACSAAMATWNIRTCTLS